MLFCFCCAQIPDELSDFTECSEKGYPDWDSLTGYLQRLDVSSPYQKKTTTPLFMPLFTSHPLSGVIPNSTITTLAVFVHGLSGAAQTYFCDAMTASKGHNAIVVAPWFGDEQVTSDFWSRPKETTVAGYSTYWTTSRWLTGGNISPGATSATQYTTAFDIMEAILKNVTGSGLYPNLKLVSLNGFSAGSQFFGRFMWASQVGGTVGTAAAATGGVPTRFLISDPGSYLYLTGERPSPQCRPLKDTGSNWQCDSWEVPPEVCADYDQYKYGIAPGTFSNLNRYLEMYDRNATARSTATRLMGYKDIRFIFGAEDSCNCNSAGFQNGESCYPGGGSFSCSPNAAGGRGCCDTYPDSTSNNAMDTNCEAMVQGSNRLQRGLMYVQHLNRVFPGRARGEFPFSVLSGMQHDNEFEFTSPEFQKYAYFE